MRTRTQTEPRQESVAQFKNEELLDLERDVLYIAAKAPAASLEQLHDTYGRITEEHPMPNISMSDIWRDYVDVPWYPHCARSHSQQEVLDAIDEEDVSDRAKEALRQLREDENGGGWS